MNHFAVAALVTLGLAACGSGAVESAPTINSFSANPTTLPAGGGNVTISWNVAEAASMSVSPGGGSSAGGRPENYVGSYTPMVTETTTFTLSATNAKGTTTASVTVTVATATDYGAQFVGTWVGPWYLCSDVNCASSTQLGTFTTEITESGINNLVMDSQFTDNAATAVTCTNGYTITASDGGTATYNGFASVGTLNFTGTYSCTASGVAACSGVDLNVTFTGATGDLFIDGALGIEYQVNQACAGGGASEQVFYELIPLIKQ